MKKTTLAGSVSKWKKVQKIKTRQIPFSKSFFGHSHVFFELTVLLAQGKNMATTKDERMF